MNQGIVWKGTEILVLECGRRQNEMEENAPYFPINFILDFVHGIYGKYVLRVINDILTEVFNINSILCRLIMILRLCVLRNQFT